MCHVKLCLNAHLYPDTQHCVISAERIKCSELAPPQAHLFLRILEKSANISADLIQNQTF